MAKTIVELKADRTALAGEMRSLITKAETETRNLSPEEATRFGEIENRHKALTEDIERRERLAHYEGFGPGGNRQSDPLPHETEKRHSYSVAKALYQSVEAREGSGRLDGLELEVHQELAKRRATFSNHAPKGVMIPLNLSVLNTDSLAHRDGYSSKKVEQRAFDTSAATGVIPTILGSTMIDILRTRTVVIQAGAKLLTGMQGLFSIPRQSGASTGYWVGEGSAPTTSAPASEQVPFTPKTTGGFVDYTRRALIEAMASIDLEMFLRDDLTKVISRMVDLGAISGTGSSNQPTGITANSSIPTNAMGTNGGDPTWTSLVGMETTVATSNADDGALKYVTNAKVRGKLKRVTKDSNTAARYLWDSQDAGGPVNSYPCLISNQVSSTLTKGTSSGVCSAMIFGNWNDLVIAMWSGIDLMTDPYSLSTSGGVRITALQDVDINVRHPESFVKTLDLTTV